MNDLVRVRTLGTGRVVDPSGPAHSHSYPCLGTFARVCLVRPSHGTEADRSKVYALKILRKTEGRFTQKLGGQGWQC